MKRYFYVTGILFLLSGCAAPLVRIIDKKEVPRPYSNCLVIYVDGNIDLRFLDSTTYDICIRTGFSDTSKSELRRAAEEMLSGRLSSAHTAVFKSADLFHTGYDSYENFLDELKRLSIESVLVVDFGRNPHIAYNSGTRLSTSPYYFNHRDKEMAPSVTNTLFQCYLIDVKSKFPVWSAQLDAKGKNLTSGKNNLRSSTVNDIAMSLSDGGYVFAH